MEENNANVEIFEEDSVIELFDENEQAVKFLEIASIELDGKFYELLQPAEPMEGIGEDEAVIFEYTVHDDAPDELNFTPLFDEELLERVFNEYLKAVSEYDCDCCDDCCGDDCHCGHGEHECDDECGCHCHHEHKE